MVSGAHIWCGRCQSRGPYCLRWALGGLCPSGSAPPGHWPSMRPVHRTPRRCEGSPAASIACLVFALGPNSSGTLSSPALRHGMSSLDCCCSACTGPTPQEGCMICPRSCMLGREASAPLTALYDGNDTHDACVELTNGAECAELRGEELLDGPCLLGSLHQLCLLGQSRPIHSRDHLRRPMKSIGDRQRARSQTVARYGAGRCY